MAISKLRPTFTFDQCGIIAQTALLGRQEDVHRAHTGQRRERLLHVQRTLGAVHARDGHFKSSHFAHWLGPPPGSTAWLSSWRGRVQS